MTGRIVAATLVGFVLSAVTLGESYRLLVRRAPSIEAVTALTALGIAWQQLNHSIEGTVLWSVTATHGLAVADLLGVPAAVLISHSLLQLAVPAVLAGDVSGADRTSRVRGSGRSLGQR
jgi:hypothetical protein